MKKIMDSKYDPTKAAKGMYQDGIYFPSRSENLCYNILCKYKDQYNLDVHKSTDVGVLETHLWKVDFTLTPINYKSMHALKKLLSICNEDPEQDLISKIYVEYKGWNDKNFSDHMRYMISQNSPALKDLILVSDKPSAYVHEYIDLRSRYKKLICSRSAFTYWLSYVYS